MQLRENYDRADPEVDVEVELEEAEAEAEAETETKSESQSYKKYQKLQIRSLMKRPMGYAQLYWSHSPQLEDTVSSNVD